jgi:hypothetical protein
VLAQVGVALELVGIVAVVEVVDTAVVESADTAAVEAVDTAAVEAVDTAAAVVDRTVVEVAVDTAVVVVVVDTEEAGGRLEPVCTAVRGIEVNCREFEFDTEAPASKDIEIVQGTKDRSAELGNRASTGRSTAAGKDTDPDFH